MLRRSPRALPVLFGLAASVTLAGCSLFGSDPDLGEAQAALDSRAWVAGAQARWVDSDSDSLLYITLEVAGEGECNTESLGFVLRRADFDGVGTYALAAPPGPWGSYRSGACDDPWLGWSTSRTEDSRLEIVQVDEGELQGRFELEMNTLERNDPIRFVGGRFRAPFVPAWSEE